MSAPRISVIIPVFNDNGALSECLTSLKKQTFRDFETIIVDDGSGVPVVIPSEAEGSLLIRFEKNRGAPAARNAGFARSQGEFVIFLDDDAALVPDALEIMLKTLEAHPNTDFVYPSFKYGLKSFKGRPFDEQALREEPYIHTSALIRRSAFPGFDEALKKFQDWDLFLTMTEQGSKGIWIDRYLFTLKGRGVMSSWLPRFVYQIPWPLFGWTPITVKKYNDARVILATKHGLPPASAASPAIFWLIGIMLVEALSVIAAFHPAFSSACAGIAGVLMLIGAYLRPELAVTALVVEFFIGSKGRMFNLAANASADGGVAWRIILFAAFLLGWVLRRPKLKAVHPTYYFLAASVLLGVLLGFIRQQPFLYADANAWVAYLLLIPAVAIASTATPKQKDDFKGALRAALFWLSVKTLALFYIFSHDFGAFWQATYVWVRRSGVGEVTIITPASSAARVFIQSQIYPALATLYATMRKGKESLAFLTLCLATVLISFSRSFWIGLMAGLFILLLVILRRRIINPFANFALAGVVAVILVAGIFYIPFPSFKGSLSDVFLARADAGESAAVSRWALLPILNAKIAEAPLFGSGFGTTVTYQSSDPRLVAQNGGVDTTYAFEWGWHDIAVKLGLFGVFAYLLVLLSLFRRLGAAQSQVGQAMIVALAVINVFTPYLNHPLGIMVIILAEAWLVA
jgi:glycosyltransferase involved in cell wall biosynthesis